LSNEVCLIAAACIFVHHAAYSAFSFLSGMFSLHYCCAHLAESNAIVEQTGHQAINLLVFRPMRSNLKIFRPLMVT
jgi:hypothetical protein